MDRCVAFFWTTAALTGGIYTPTTVRLRCDDMASPEDAEGAAEEGADSVPCSGHDYRQALEIALALALSDRQDHRRVSLPLDDRSLKLYPHPYRLQGGDVAGYESIGYAGPPVLKKDSH